MDTLNAQIIGSLHIGKHMDILYTKDQEYMVQLSDNSITDFTFEERMMYLCKPWSEIKTYEDERGVHYVSNVYDSIHIDIWAPSLVELLNRLRSMLTPPEDIENWLVNRIDKANKLREKGVK